MIRTGRLSDAPRAVELLRDSRVGAGFDKPDGVSGFVFPFDPVCAERLFLAHIGTVDRYCGIMDVGGTAQGILLASAYEHPFGPVKVAKETLWWIDPEHRGRESIAMLSAYEAWAKERGCAFAGMAGMGCNPDVGRLYLRRGYMAAEMSFLKAL